LIATCHDGAVPRLDSTERLAAVAIWAVPISTLAVVPGGFERFAFAKLAVAALGVAFAFAAARSGALPRSIAILSGLIVALFVIAALAGETPWASLLGRWPRYEGLPVLLLYGACAGAGARLLATRSAVRVRQLLTALEIVAGALAITALMDAVHHPLLGPSDVTRPGALLGNATDLGIVAVLIAAVLGAAFLENPRLTTGLGVAAALLTVALSGSRAAFVGVVVVVAVLATRRAHRGVIAVGATSLVLAMVVIAPTRDRLFASDTVTGRRLLWGETWDLDRAHLAIGVGANRYVDAIGAFHSARWVREVGWQNPPDAPHNWVLQALTIGGLPLLASCLALAFAVTWRGVTRARHSPDALTIGALAAVAAYGAMLLTHFPTPGTACLAAFLTGALVGERRPGAEHAVVRFAAVAAAVVVSVCLFAAAAAEIPLRHGIDQAGSGDVSTAGSSLDRARALRPWDADLGMLAAQSFAVGASDGDTDAARAAVRWADRSLARTPDTYDSLLSRGVALIALDELDLAVRDLDRAITIGPTDPRAWLQRGIARFGLQDAEGAQSDVERATRLDPDDPVSRRVLDQMRRQVG
jgi:hypothetical protein